jgi:hypothetical protein
MSSHTETSLQGNLSNNLYKISSSIIIKLFFMNPEVSRVSHGKAQSAKENSTLDSPHF